MASFPLPSAGSIHRSQQLADSAYSKKGRFHITINGREQNSEGMMLNTSTVLKRAVQVTIRSKPLQRQQQKSTFSKMEAWKYQLPLCLTYFIKLEVFISGLFSRCGALCKFYILVPLLSRFSVTCHKLQAPFPHQSLSWLSRRPFRPSNFSVPSVPPSPGQPTLVSFPKLQDTLTKTIPQSLQLDGLAALARQVSFFMYSYAYSSTSKAGNTSFLVPDHIGSSTCCGLSADLVPTILERRVRRKKREGQPRWWGGDQEHFQSRLPSELKPEGRRWCWPGIFQTLLYPCHAGRSTG